MSRLATTALTLPMLCFAAVLTAGTLPENWSDWEAADTPLAQIGTLPGCDADVSSLPDVYQRTVALYWDVRPEGPGKVNGLASESALPSYQARNGEFPDGAKAALHLSDLGLLMVTTYEGGTRVYQVFKEDGEETTAEDGPLSADACASCHVDASCIDGQCGAIQ